MKKAPKKAKRTAKAKPKQAMHNAHSDRVVAPVETEVTGSAELVFPPGSFASPPTTRSFGRRVWDFLRGRP